MNVLAGPGSPTVSEFAEIGVRRISVGNDIAAVAYAAAVNAAGDILTTGRFDTLAGGVDYGDMQQLMQR